MDHERFELAVAVHEYDGNEFGRQFERLGGRIYRLPVPDGPIGPVAQIGALYRFFRATRPAIVQTHVLKANLYGSIAARLARVPVVIGTEMTLKDTAPSAARRLRDSIVQPAVKQALARCDKFVVTSDYIKSEWDGVPESKVEIIYPPFNLEKLRQAKSVTSTTDSETVRICYVGRLSEEKGVGLLLDAMRLVHSQRPSAKLTIVGTGPMAEQLGACADEAALGGCVEFRGYMRNSFEALGQADVFVLPSRSEGCPIVILEAMAMGLPVVATAVGGSVELVRHDETGLLVPYGEPQLLAQALIGLVDDRKRARRMGKRGRELAMSTFHPSRFVERLQQLYQELLRERHVDLSPQSLSNASQTPSVAGTRV